MDQQIVVFELGTEAFGVKIAAVESIIKLQPITQLPHAPVYIEGVTNLRGKVIPVVNLRRRFGLPARGADQDSRIMVVSVDHSQVGMMVDGVDEVLTVASDSIEPAPSLTTTLDSAFITGIARLEERLVILLDLDQVLGVGK